MNDLYICKEIVYYGVTMETRITITSKRQITIPKKIWEQLNLENVRYFQAKVEDGNIKLRKFNFSSQLDKFWDKTSESVKGELSDASIKRASHEAHRNKLIF